MPLPMWMLGEGVKHLRVRMSMVLSRWAGRRHACSEMGVYLRHREKLPVVGEGMPRQRQLAGVGAIFHRLMIAAVAKAGGRENGERPIRKGGVGEG